MAGSGERYSRYTTGGNRAGGNGSGGKAVNGNGNGRQRRPDDSSSGNRRRRVERRRGRFLWLKILVVVVFLLVVAVAGAAAGTVIAVSRNLPNIDKLKPVAVAQTSFVYDRKGRLIGELHGAENRIVVSSKRIPQVLKQATVAIEDERFYQHHGIDLEGIVRAAVTDIKAGAMVQGASTITAQFVRNAYAQLSQEKTFSRKIKEMVLSWQLENKWSKDRILTAYLNTIFYGNNSYGCEAISRTLFHKSVSKLTLPQAALIAGMANAPSYYNPVTNPKACKERRDIVLAAMLKQKYITQSEYDDAVASPIKVFKKPVDRNLGPQAYFLDYVTRELVDKLGQNQVFAGGLRIYTTLDLDWQKKALDVVKSVLYSPTDPAAALVSIDPKTGAIRTMVGGLNFKTQKYNLASQSDRQLGSAAKPFALAAAVEQGAEPSRTFYNDQTVDVSLPGYGTYHVLGEGNGRVDLNKATALSLNSVFVQLGADVGPENVYEMMHRMGIKSEFMPVLSTPLGTGVFNPLEVASAYATFADEGVYHEPQAVKVIKNTEGRIVYRAKHKGKRVIPDWVAYYCIQAMKGVLQYGTAAQFGYPQQYGFGYGGRIAAGKTGTTDAHADAWFCGFTPQLATAVWMGYKDNRTPMYSIHGTAAWGGAWSTDIWAQFMQYAMRNYPNIDFPMYKGTPQWVTWKGKYSGMAASASPSPSPSASASAKPQTTTSAKPTNVAPTTSAPTPTPTPTLPPTEAPTTTAPTVAPTTTVPTTVPPTEVPTTTSPVVTP